MKCNQCGKNLGNCSLNLYAWHFQEHETNGECIVSCPICIDSTFNKLNCFENIFTGM